MNIHRSILVATFIVLGASLSGCAHIIESLPGYRHAAFLPIGGARSEVLPQAEHVLGQPLDVGHHEKADLERRVYPFRTDSHLVLYFFNGAFVEADLYDRERKTYDNVLLDSTRVPEEYFEIFDRVSTNFPESGGVTGFVISSDSARKDVRIEPIVVR